MTRSRGVQGVGGFTLIELLVVISIVVLLIALLLPSLGAARRSAQTAACAANVHNIMLGFAIYAHDYSDRMPYQAQLPLNDRCDWSFAIAGYLGSQSIFRCPSDPNERSPVWNDRPWRSYAVNAAEPWTYLGNGYKSPWPNPRTNPPLHRLSDIPSHVLMVGQNDGHDGLGTPDDPQGSWNGIIGVSTAVVGIAEFEGLNAYAWDLHQSTGINYGFSDGHVQFLTRAEVNTYRADTDYGGDPGDRWKWK